MSRTVLVVDDEPDIVLAARLVLEASGCVVIQAASGEAALELLEADKTDVEAVFLDLRMPGLDGWRVLKELRVKGISKLPVIVLSAYCDPIAIEQSSELGAAGYISKPFHAVDLTRMLEAVFEPLSEPNRTAEASAGTQ
jgi:CheY-like chemotaxis protein